MTTGVEVDVADGVATVAFTDLSLRGVGVGRLLAAGGPQSVTKVTRPRVAYVVPEEVARAAGLLDTEFDPGDDSEPQGYDDGKPDMDWSRAAINDYATKAGVEAPESLQNKQAVLDAITAKEAADAAPPAVETPGETTPPAVETPGDGTPGQ